MVVLERHLGGMFTNGYNRKEYLYMGEDITDWLIDREDCSGYSFEKEKTADEIFEKLGYEKINDDEYGVIYEKGTSTRNRIIFKRTNKTVCCILIDENYEWNDAMEIDMQELQAINKKCQELRWL